MFVVVAAVLIAILSVVLISDAVRSAQGVVLRDAGNTLAAAVSELKRQSQDRVGLNSDWKSLSAAAQNSSLHRISQTVLRLYPGVEGGYFDGGRFLGYSYPTHDTGGDKTDVPTAERGDILDTILKSQSAGGAMRVLRGRHDLVVIEAKAGDLSGLTTWAMKRLAGESDPGAHRRELLLSALVIAALISIAGSLAAVINLRRGVLQIQAGLAALETDFGYRLAERADEIGEIGHSINRMAEARQRLEGELRREDRLRTVGRLTASIAHEIRNPLNSIRLTIQFLERRVRTNQVRAEDLRPVIEEVDRLSGLTSMLTFQQSREPVLGNHPVASVLDKCVKLIQPQADARSITLRTNYGPAGIRARFDPEQLIQIVTNLFLNAVEAIGNGGTIESRVEPRGETVRILLHDSGPGLTKEQADHLFEAFYTSKPEGTGLGLAVSWELAKRMGASLHYENGRPGATFVIELPVGEVGAGLRGSEDYAKHHDTHR
ncbi:MAG TPA: HAMP domain-containing sensor histidine kinase [Bryobacteraceae bacterium]|nr:HAMP domain-containing sensor histidine kinase [Bryobacteraceae bacterium]